MAAIRQSPQKLKKGAENLLDRFEQGELEVIKFVTERIDGKAIQPIAHSLTEETHDESQLDAEIRQLAGKIGLALSSQEKARAEDAPELPNIH